MSVQTASGNIIRIETTQAARKGTVLMIHGWAQNSRVFLHKTMTLTRKMKNAGYDVVFLEAPFVLPMTSTVEIDGKPVEISNGGRKNARAWFVYNSDDPSDASEAQSGKPMHYFGLEDSIASVDSFLSSLDEDEFCAVFGFSQGGSFAHILAAIADGASKASTQQESIRRNARWLQRIRCIVCAGAFAGTHVPEQGSKHEVDLSEHVHVPSLHVIGTKDTSVLPERSHELAAMFDNAATYLHEKGHLVSQNSASCAAILSFLDKIRSIQ